MILSTILGAQVPVLLDEDFSEWNTVTPTVDSDNDGLQNGIDFKNLWLSSDAEYVYIRIQIGKEIEFQDNNDLVFFIDIDNDQNTGFPTHGIGADLRYFPGLRNGIAVIDGFNYTVFHNDIGLISSPTVSADEFEILIRRESIISGRPLDFGSQIRMVWTEDALGGDRLPDSGSVLYELNNTPMELLPVEFDKKDPSHLRIISHNALRDGMFEGGSRKASFERLLMAANPDIIGYQEIYDHTAEEVKEFVQDVLPGTWYARSRFPDVHLISRYPITNSRSINGNGAFLVDVDGRKMLVINAHLPCCENDFDRQREVDHIMSFIRECQNGTGEFDLEVNTPIVILGDMNLVGDRQQQQTLLDGNIINESEYGPDFTPDWDGTNLEDASPVATGIPAAVTWVQEFSSFSPGRLDYIIYTGSQMSLQNTYGFNTATMTQDQLNETNLLWFDSFNASDHLLCVSDFSFEVNTSVDQPGQRELGFRFFPNPAQGQLTIELEVQTLRPLFITIDNLNGKTIQETTVQPLAIGGQKFYVDISSIKSGAYLVSVNGNAQPFFKL